MGYSIKNGDVVYHRGADSNVPYWRQVHYSAIAGADNIGGLYTNTENENRYFIAGKNLAALGAAERQKELALIRAAGFNVSDEEDIKTFIERFNEVLMGKEQFEMAKNRLKEALDSKNQDKKSRAPTIASWYTSYLGTALNKNLSGFLSSFSDRLDVPFSAWINSLDDLIDKSIIDAFEAMLTKVKAQEGKELYGDSDQWREIYELSQTMNGFNDYFISMIRSKINFNNLQGMLQNESIKLKNKERKGIRTFIDGKSGLNLRNGKKSRSIGGSVQEYLMTLLNSLGTAAQSSAQGSRVLSSEIAKTDNVQLFSYSTSINTGEAAQAIVDALNDQIEDATSLKYTSQIMESFYNNYLSKMDDSFIVYGSTKSYSMSESFRGFSGGSSGSLESAVDILAQAGVGSSTAIKQFVNVAYNTGTGAYFDGRRTEVETELKAALMSAIAHLLFDDWVTIGEHRGGASSIHVLQLEGINLPMSALLTATGQAMMSASKEMSSLVKVTVKLPGAIKYDTPINTSSKEVVKEAWREQAALARAESSYSIRFLTNFKTLITQWL